MKYRPVIIFILAVSLTATYICFADECAGIRKSASEIIEAGLDYEKTAELYEWLRVGISVLKGKIFSQ